MSGQVKEGSAYVELHPACRYGMEVAAMVWANEIGGRPVFTSLQDRRHSDGSLHYGIPGDLRCRAFDLRIWESVLPEDKAPLVLNDLKRRLGPDFDVVVEDDHWHVEWDPKPWPGDGNW